MFNVSRYYIFDCNNDLVGNPDGYLTYSRAAAVVNRKGYSLDCLIWQRFYKKVKTSPTSVLVYSVKLGSTLIKG